MSFIHCLLLTIVSTLICITLPKVLSLILAPRTQRTAPSQPALTPQEVPSEVPSFPY